MAEPGALDYFYGTEAEQYTFYRIPKVLFTDPGFRRITADAKILYGLMLDRMGLSMRNGWLDEQERVFIYFTLEEAMDAMCCGHNKAVSLFTELDKVGLIERKKQGQGRPTKIYVKNFIRKEEVKTSENRKSALPETGTLDFRKSDTINTDKNKTDRNDTDPSIHPAAQPSEDRPPTAADTMDTIRAYREILKENIEYDILRKNLGYDCDLLDEILDILVDTVCSTRKMIRIGGEDYPKEVVKSRLLKLDSGHIEYVIHSLHENTTKVRNIRAYLLTSLYKPASPLSGLFQVTGRGCVDRRLCGIFRQGGKAPIPGKAVGSPPAYTASGGCPENGAVSLPQQTAGGDAMKNLPKINPAKAVKASLPYLIAGLLCTKLGEAYRLTTGGDVIDRLLAAFIKLGLVFQNPLPSLHPFDLLVGAAAAVLLRLVVWSKIKNAKKYRHGEEYGTARWGNEKDIAPFINSDFSQNILLTDTERLTLGKIADPEKRNVNLNVLVIGDSGSGKTRYHIKPNLLQMNASYVCSDPKGTVVEEVGRALVQQGHYKLKILNTIDFGCSMHYNPFHYLHSETDILSLVTVIMENTQSKEGKGGDDFWSKAEALLYQALIAYIYYEAPEEEKNMTTLLDMLNACECREDDENFKSAVDLLFEQLEQRDANHFAVRQYKKFKMAAGKTLKSILISCGARLAPFDIQAVREMMEYDELELEKLGEEKIALFAVVSDSDPTFNFISAMMYSQMFNVLCNRALTVYHGRLPVHVTCLFDEFANQKIPNWEHLVSVIRSRNISAHIVLQTYSQLKGMYRDNAETIAGCCSSLLFLGGKEESSLKMVATMLGMRNFWRPCAGKDMRSRPPGKS